MPGNICVESRGVQYIARISHGKDSLKMLDVIASRGLPLDRITTTDIWATDSIRGEHPKMVEFKVRADERFQLEDEGFIYPGERFRWSDLEFPNYRLF